MEKKETISGNLKITFYPKTKRELTLCREKGKKYWWKLFCLVPLFKYTARENYYDNSPCCPTNFGGTVRFWYHNNKNFIYDYENEVIYQKPHVVVENISNNDSKVEHFETEKEALQYYEKVMNRGFNHNLAA